MKRFKMFILFLFLCLGLAAQGLAAQATATLTIDDALGPGLMELDPYFLNPGDTYEWAITYDRSKLTGSGSEFLSPQKDASLDIDVNLGWSLNVPFQAALFYPQGPMLMFTDGLLDGFANFIILDNNPMIEKSYLNIMSGDQYECLFLNNMFKFKEPIYTGHFTFETLSTPIPPSFVLLSFSLLALVGVRPRKDRQ
jgi:hypothetical protein